MEWSDISQRKWDVRRRLRAARHKLSLLSALPIAALSAQSKDAGGRQSAAPVAVSVT